MDTTIRNLDPHLYRALKARAALQGKTIGEVVNEAIADYLNLPQSTGRRSLSELTPEDYPAGSQRLSEEVNATVYGV